MPNQVNLAPYKYTVNGKTYYDVVPNYNVSNQYTPATTQELQNEIASYQGKNDSWSQNYVQSLQAGLSKIQANQSPYALNDKGVLATQGEITNQQDVQNKLASGNYTNLGTAEVPKIVPKGSAGEQLSTTTGANQQAIQDIQTQTGQIATPQQIQTQVQLNAMRSQLEQARKQVENLGQSPSTLSTSPNSTLYNGTISQNAPNASPDIYGALSTASGIKATTPEQSALQSEIQRIQEQQQNVSSGIKGLLSKEPAQLNYDQITQQALQSLGLPADFNRTQFDLMQKNAAEIQSLSQNLNDINKREEQRLIQIEGQAIPMDNISNQSIQAKRYFAADKAAVAADIQAKAAYGEVLKGNYEVASQLIDKATALATHEKDQEISDWKWMFSNYKDEYDSLSNQEQKLFGNLIDSLQKERDLTRDDLKNKLSLYLDNNVPIPDMATVSSMSLEDVAKYVSQHKVLSSSNQTPTYTPGSVPAVDNWAKLIISGQAKITDVPNPRGSTLRSQVIDAINNSGQLLLSDKDREKLSVLDTAFNVYDTIKGLSEKINTFGPIGRVTGFLGRYLGGATQINTDIARYNAARSGFVSNVARTLGEKGTLAEGDVQRAIANLPTINDTADVAQKKLETLRSILEGARTSIIQKSTEPAKSLTPGTLNQGDNSYQNYLQIINATP